MIVNPVPEILDPALALLPPSMDTVRARMMLLAIGLQESRFEHRRQIGTDLQLQGQAAALQLVLPQGLQLAQQLGQIRARQGLGLGSTGPAASGLAPHPVDQRHRRGAALAAEVVAQQAARQRGLPHQTPVAGAHGDAGQLAAGPLDLDLVL